MELDLIKNMPDLDAQYRAAGSTSQAANKLCGDVANKALHTADTLYQKTWTAFMLSTVQDGNSKNANYPGVKMTFLDKSGTMEQDVYYIDIDKSFTKVIFSNGSNNEKTVDISLKDSVNAYYVSGGGNGAYTVTKQKRD